MELEIRLKPTSVLLTLLETVRVVDSVSFSYYHDLDRKLLTFLDKLLKKNKIDINSVKGYKILGNTGTEGTAHKIVEAFVEGLKV